MELNELLKLFIATRGWYQENLKVSDCITKNKDGKSRKLIIETCGEIIKLRKKMNDISHQLIANDTNPDEVTKYKLEVIQNNKKIHETEEVLYIIQQLPEDYRQDIDAFLNNIADKDQQIQDVIKLP